MDQEREDGETNPCPVCRVETYHVRVIRTITLTSSQWNGDRPDNINQSLWQCVACGSLQPGRI